MIEVLFLDCDGVLTTGTYLYDDTGKKLKEFSSIDSNGIKKAKSSDITVEIISSDPTGADINEARCRDMRVKYHRSIDESKDVIAARRLKELDTVWDKVAMIGDDVTDIPILERVGYPITVPNGVEPVKEVVEQRSGYITENEGGRGAVAEAIRHILNKQK